jgi:hypothetical protein
MKPTNQPKTGAEVNTTWSYVLSMPFVFRVSKLIKHKGNFTLSLILMLSLRPAAQMHYTCLCSL